MDSKDTVLVTHREAIIDLAKTYKVHSVALVGSVARGEDTPESDFDFLVEFSADASLFDHAGLEVGLARLLGRRVDVVSKDGLTARTRGILEDAIPL